MWRKAHGKAAQHGALVAIETAPPDELPGGVLEVARPAPIAYRDAKGRFQKGNPLAAVGGKARGERHQLARLLGFASLPDGHRFARYHRLAREWRAEHARELASTVGGGHLSPGVSSVIASAALSLAASRFLYDRATKCCDPKLFGQAARLADQSKQALLTAHELAAREARARREQQSAPTPWFVATTDPEDSE